MSHISNWTSAQAAGRITTVFGPATNGSEDPDVLDDILVRLDAVTNDNQNSDVNAPNGLDKSIQPDVSDRSAENEPAVWDQG